MTCPWCSYDNQPSARFCGDCGRSIECDVVCDSCSTQNPASHRFCDRCGTPLGKREESLQAVGHLDEPRTVAATDGAKVCPRALASFGGATLLRLPIPGLVWYRPATQWNWSWRRFADWAKRNRFEVGVVALLTIVGAVLRLYRLAEVPGGLPGDEALTGLDALRIVKEGWIGPYVGSALGQTTGPLYFTALVFALSEPTIFTLHLSMALLGVATIPATYMFLTMGFGRWVALFATVALTFSYWHLFYSRAAFMVVSMPLMTTLAAAAILVALRSPRRWVWFIAGALLGLGVYSYNGYLMFLTVVAVFFGIVLILGRDNLKLYSGRGAVLAIGFMLSAFPLIHFAYSNPESYSQRFRTASVLREPNLEAASSLGQKFEYFAERAWDAATIPLRHPEIDFVDGLGGRGALDPIIGLLAYAGLVIAVAKWRSPPHLLLALSFVFGLGVLLLGRENVGEFRRTFVIVPFVYGLAGVAVVTGGQWVARSLGKWGKPMACSAGAIILTVAAIVNLVTYFGGIVQEDHMDWIYASDLVDVLNAAHEFDDPGAVYFYSGRWSYNYETRRFLYPDTPGLDRSREFGEYSLERLGDEGPVTYVLLPPYAGEIDALRKKYPGGEAVKEYDANGVMRYSIYRLP